LCCFTEGAGKTEFIFKTSVVY